MATVSFPDRDPEKDLSEDEIADFMEEYYEGMFTEAFLKHIAMFNSSAVNQYQHKSVPISHEVLNVLNPRVESHSVIPDSNGHGGSMTCTLALETDGKKEGLETQVELIRNLFIVFNESRLKPLCETEIDSMCDDRE